MDQFYKTAIAMYQRALTIFAERSGGTATTIPDAQVSDATVQQAEKMALGLPSHQPGQPVLHSIMGRLLGGTAAGYYKPQVIANTREVVLPKIDGPYEREEVTRAYADLWRSFAQEFSQWITSAQPVAVQEASLHALLHRYCWAMPAPGAEEISLFDFARTAAALAVCLEAGPENPQEPALLVGADLSGVQDWLYTLSSDGAARSLRGRSVYLQLLMEVIALDLLHELELPMANLLYVGGGNFYLLAPIGRKESIGAYRQKASQRLLKMHQGALYLTLAANPVRAEELTNSDAGKAWQRIAEALNVQKARRFADLSPTEMAEAIGAPLDGTGLPERTCRVCQRSISAEELERTRPVAANADETERKCALCVAFDELGGMLSSANFLAVSRISPEPVANVIHWRDAFKHFGADVQFLKNLGRGDGGWESVNSEMVRLFYWQAMPKAQDFSAWPGDTRPIWTFRPLAQAVPLNEDRWGKETTATFSDLKTEGIDRWGVLRMDVDRLGEIFQKGIQPASLARAVSLSGFIRLFFEGYVPQIADRYNQPDKPCVHLMYAGGDDLFVVGGWSWLPELAAEIQQVFSVFACHNPNVTISGGISIALAEKYPLYQAARDGGRAEDQAKNAGRNALSFLGEPVTWKIHEDDGRERIDSYKRVHKRVQDLVSWLPNGREARLPRSFLMTLRAIDAEWREWKKQEQKEKVKQGIEPRYAHTNTELCLGPWMWRLVYSLTRAADRTKDNSLKADVERFSTAILAGEIQTLGLIARWTELLTRKVES